MRLSLCLPLFLLLSTTARAGDDGGAAQDPFTLLSELSDRLYVIGETTAKPEDYRAAAAEAAARLSELADADPDVLVGKNARGLTPLGVAVENGFPEIVEVLLRSDAVKAAINSADSDGFTPWISASFAFAEAPWVCNPHVLDDPQRWVPSWVKQPYYLSGAAGNYGKVRAMLEAAGARPDPKAAADLYLRFCKNAAPETRTRIESGGDLLDIVEAQGATMLDRLQKQANQQ